MDTLVKDTLVEPQVATDLTKMARFLNSLPPLVAAVVRDVVDNNVTAATIDLARQATSDQFEKYDVIRCVAAGNPNCPPTEEALWLVEEMIK